MSKKRVAQGAQKKLDMKQRRKYIQFFLESNKDNGPILLSSATDLTKVRQFINTDGSASRFYIRGDAGLAMN